MLTRTVGVISLSHFLQPPFRNSILIRYLSIIYHDSESGSRQIRTKETSNTFAGICKNCAIPSLRRDTFSSKVPGFESALASGNAYYHNRRAVMWHRKPKNTSIQQLKIKLQKQIISSLYGRFSHLKNLS